MIDLVLAPFETTLRDMKLSIIERTDGFQINQSSMLGSSDMILKRAKHGFALDLSLEPRDSGLVGAGCSGVDHGRHVGR